jgi:hypothetical protein
MGIKQARLLTSVPGLRLPRCSLTLFSAGHMLAIEMGRILISQFRHCWRSTFLYRSDTCGYGKRGAKVPEFQHVLVSYG